MKSIQQASRVKTAVLKLAASMYPDSDRRLNGTMLFDTIKHIIFDYVFQISPELRNKRYSKGELTKMAHWLHFWESFSAFSEEWEKTVTYIKRRVLHDLESRCEDDHPLLFVFKCVTEMHEMHIRHPKQSPASASHVFGEPISHCQNVVNLRSCTFGGVEKYAEHIFTPLPSDADFKLRDPEEGDDNFRLALKFEKMTNTLPKEYNVSEQFSVILTPEWGRLIRMLHNIFHLYDYINVDVLGVVDKYRRKAVREKYPNLVAKIDVATKSKPCDDEKLAALLQEFETHVTEIWIDEEWEKIWETIVTPEYAKEPVSRFKKAKTAPELVSSIAQIVNIVNGALKLIKTLQK